MDAAKTLAVIGYSSRVGGGLPGITIYDMQMHSGEEKKVLAAGSDIYALTFSPDGKLLASGEKFGIIRLWNTSDWTLRHKLRE